MPYPCFKIFFKGHLELAIPLTSSGLKSIMLADQSIKTGNSKIVIAGGMESMSLAPHYLQNSRKGTFFGHSKVIDSILKDGYEDLSSIKRLSRAGMGRCQGRYCANMLLKKIKNISGYL